jgi:hypothetical protein
MLDYAFRVEWDDARVGELVEDVLGWFRVNEEAALPTYTLQHSPRDGMLSGYLNGRRFHRATSLGGLVNRLLSRLNSEAIRRTKSFLLLHAGAASWKGGGILLPAATESGKTTLVAGLIRAGFGYLSDEAAAIDPVSGWVHPYPKPLSMEPSSIEAIRDLANELPPEYGWGSRVQYQIRPSDMRPRSTGTACPVRYVVAPQYDRNHQTELHPISRAEAVIVLADNSFNLRRFGSRGVITLAGMVEGAECYRLRIGELDEAVRVMVDLVRR